MCRLFGFRSAVPSKAHRSLVAARNALSEQARDHRDGWGIGYFEGRKATVVRSVNPAGECARFRAVSEELASHTFVVHVRKATVGSIRPENVHPFKHGPWLFAHNGTIHGFEQLSRKMRDSIPTALGLQQEGSTDTELLFHYLLGALSRGGIALHGEPDVEEIGAILHDAIARLRSWAEQAGAATPSANFLLTNGAVFLANRHGREMFFATQKRICGDALFCKEPDKVCLLARRPHDKVNHLIVASERIGDEDEWEEVPDGGMVMLRADFRLRFRRAA